MTRRTVFWLCLLTVTAPTARGAEPMASDAVEFFEKKIRPVLVAQCYECHSATAEKLRGNLLLDSRAGLLKGGDLGPAIVPGDPEKSRLIRAVRFKDVRLQMPERGKLPDAVIADLEKWVAQGAVWPGDGGTTTVVKKSFDLEQRKRDHWAWQPVKATAPPAVKDGSWPRVPIDRFILAKLELHGLTPAADTDARTLIRRLSFDLIGLPPTPEEIDAFEKQYTAEPQAATEALVDRLLDSPHFGERWGRHWLDLVRYADSRGHEFDYSTPNAYQYRDYVIRALNADVPYNQFVTEHLAGDLLAKPRLSLPTPPLRGREVVGEGAKAAGVNESILGTGFWFLGEEVHSPVDIRQDEADRFDNRIDVLTKTFLGLTVSCARCHDHKFDAISTKDYYALAGFLQSSNYRLARFETMEQNRHIAAALAALRERARPAIHKAIATSLRPTAQRLKDYLLAATEAANSGKVEEIAAKNKLDAAILGEWVSLRAKAAKDPTDPFHLWAKVNDNRAAAALVRSFLAEPGASPVGVKVIVDYGKMKPDDWLPDDVSYGVGPMRPGDVQITADPSVRLTERAAAAFDPIWAGVKPAPGSETSPGALSSPMRPGRSIRTPTFTLESGKVSYLVRGSAQAYFAVDSHVLIAGPLHARLVTPVRAGAEFRWLSHDLTPYRGQRVHIEFAAESPDFAVALVVQGDHLPPSAPDHAELRAALVGAESVETLAANYQKWLLGLTDRLDSDRLLDSAESARLTIWLLARPGLFVTDGKTPKIIADTVALFRAEQQKIAAQIRAESRLALAIQDGTSVNEHVFIRGSHKNPGELVPRRFLEALAGPKPLVIAHGSGRLELAGQITDPATNPLIARVIVNRLWHHLFGRGIVASVDNFGVLGEAPTHPELLDYLADQFVKDGWSMKKTIRAMVLSRTYRMSSHADEKADNADPNDLWLHRARVRRLEGEAIRDALLAVSGRLDRTMFGPPVPVYLTPFQDGRGRPASGPLDGNGRRSVYLAVRRNFLSPFLLAFDTPIPFSTVGRRTVSNVPAQALILMNDPFVHQQAEVWAKRVLAKPGTAKERVTGMYRSAFGRPPTEAERAACLAFLERQAQAFGTNAEDARVWADLAHTLVNVKEFIFVN